MHHAQLLELVRQIVRETFASHGTDSLDDWCETILIRDGYYCGRRFTCGDLRAIWFIEENSLKIFSQEVGLLCSQSVAEVESTRTVAA